MYRSAKRERDGLQEELLRGCYRKSLELARDNGCESVAFSALSTGVYGYPSGEAAEVVAREVRAWLESEEGKEGGLKDVVICNFMQKDEDAYEEVLPKYFPPVEEEVDKKEDKEESKIV